MTSKTNRSSEQSLERFKPVLAYALAHSSAEEASVVMYAHLPAGQKICDGRNRLVRAARTGTYCQDEIA